MKIAQDDSNMEMKLAVSRDWRRKMSERTDECAAEHLSESSCVEQASESLVRANELANVRMVMTFIP